MRVYIAAPFFNPEQLAQVIAVEKLLSERTWIEFFSPRCFGVIKDLTSEQKEKEMKIIYDMHVEKLLWCDVAIVLVDHKDTGTAWEFGFLAGRNKIQFDKPDKLIFTVSLEDKPVDAMLKYCVHAHSKAISELEKLLTYTGKLSDFWRFDASLFRNDF